MYNKGDWVKIKGDVKKEEVGRIYGTYNWGVWSERNEGKRCYEIMTYDGKLQLMNYKYFPEQEIIGHTESPF